MFTDQDYPVNWWQKDIDSAAKELGTDLNKGLFLQTAGDRLHEYGHNELQEAGHDSALDIFLAQFRSFIIWVLIAAAVISGFLNEWGDALAILAVVILNAFLGFIQEYRAERSLAALKKMSSPVSRIIRSGVRGMVPSRDLVPGDLMEIEAGDNLQADCRLAWATQNFSVQEASLTGESTPVAKTVLPLNMADVGLADRANMVYMGTSVVAGKARALVVSTGMRTELGKIAGMIQKQVSEQTPLQRKLEEFGRWIVYICFALVGIVFLLEMLRGGKILDVFLTAVSLAVAAIPEGLPAVVTVALALGVQRMVKRNALIRKLPSVETLGCATVICSDKTGTLTKNEMTVQRIAVFNRVFSVEGTGYSPIGDFLLDGNKVAVQHYPELKKTLECGVLCNGAELVLSPGNASVVGDPTEGAILVAAAKMGIDKAVMEKAFPFVEEIPFDPRRKKMSMIRRQGDKFTVFVKGAPDILLEDCSEIEENGVRRRLTQEEKKRILDVNNGLADGAMRVLAVAYRTLDGQPDEYNPDFIERYLVFCGLIAMMDPPRPEAAEAVAKCRKAGIRIVMITGDHKNTAVAIARSLGFFEKGSAALSGEELDRLSEEEFAFRVEDTAVYARVSPEHKLRIVRAWRRRGEIVAMTGDGVNDAPAVKEADIGVAMGITGTDVTKEVSDMVVTDDNFSSIVAAVEEGRGIYGNIRKFIHYLLSCNTGEIMVMFIASVAGLPVPLLPIHILWVNLVTDSLPALALGVEPVEPDIMSKPPRDPQEKIIDKQRLMLMLFQGSLIAFCSLSAFIFEFFFRKQGLMSARTAAFIVLSCSQLFHAFNCRSAGRSVFAMGIFSNIKLVAAVLFSFLLLLAAVYLPIFSDIFSVSSPDLLDWVVMVALSSLPLWCMELIKKMRKIKE